MTVLLPDAPTPKGGGAGRPPLWGGRGGVLTWPLPLLLPFLRRWPLPFPRRWVIFFLFYLSLLSSLCVVVLLFAALDASPSTLVALFSILLLSLFLLFRLWPSFAAVRRHEIPLQRALGAHAALPVYAPVVTDDRARSLGRAVPLVLDSTIGDFYAAYLLDVRYATPSRLNDACAAYALPRGYLPSPVRLPLGGSRLGVVFLRPPAIGSFSYAPGRWWVGFAEGGYPYPLDGVRAHWLVVGRTGGGKSHCLRGLVREFAVAPTAVSLYGIDVKGGVELGPDGRYFAALADDLDVARDLLADMLAWLRAEFVSMRADGHRQRPLQRVLIVDELSIVVADRVCAQHLDELLRLGRAAGLMVVGATQSAQKSVLSVRDHFGLYVVLPLDDAQSAMLVPLSADELAVLAPYRLPGVGLIYPAWAWAGAYPIAPDRAVGLVRFALV